LKVGTSLQIRFNITVKAIEAANEITKVMLEVFKWCVPLSIKTEPSATDTQAQNGGVERSRGIIKEKVRAVRLDANLPWHLWLEITRAAVYLYNRTPNFTNGGKSPYERFFTRTEALNGIVPRIWKQDFRHDRRYTPRKI
jgi:hypothetical protein